MCVLNYQDDEWLSGAADEPLCTVLSNNHNFHLTGKWYDEKCSESGYGFVCQKGQGERRCVFVLLAVVSLMSTVSLVFKLNKDYKNLTPRVKDAFIGSNRGLIPNQVQ